MNDFYFEICIIPSNFFDIFVSEVADFTKQAIQEDTKDGHKQIIVRSNENLETTLMAFLNELCKNLTQINSIDVSFKYSVSKCKMQDYMETYKKSVTAIECRDFYIHPSWIESKENKISITLDPSLAFGTGHHASTFMSIESIVDCIKNRFNYPISLLDVGCGSGILSLCAYKMGAKVSLCDIDELAINEAKKNFLINNATITDIWLGSLENTNNKYDIVVANIVASVIIEQAKNLLNLLNANACLILSGILDEYASLVKDKFKSLRLIDEKIKDEWVTFIYLSNIKEHNETKQ